MAVTTNQVVTQNLHKKFSYRGMQTLMGYLSTFNCETQTLAIDANKPDIQSTGTKLAFINGQPVQIEADAALDISADTEGTLTAWATATSYSVGDVRSSTLDTIRVRCIAAHTSSADTEPLEGPSWETYWEVAPHGATNASGTSLAAAYSQWFMVTAKGDGTLTVWLSGDAATHGNEECKIPQFDHKMYVCVGFLHIKNATASAFVLGTTNLDTASITTTYCNITGPVFPHEDNWDAN